MKQIIEEPNEKSNNAGEPNALSDISNLLDCKALQTQMEKFYALTGVGMAILDMHGKLIVSTGWQDICVKFHRANPDSAKLCKESDISNTRDARPGSIKAYICPHHLRDIVTPIMVNDIQVGIFFIGQFLFTDETLDLETFRKQAKTYGYDEEEYLAALSKIPRWDRDYIQKVMDYYLSITEMLSYQGVQNSLLQQTLAEREEHLATIDLHLLALDHIYDRITITDLDGNIKYVNQAEEQSMGYSKSELLKMNVKQYGDDDSLGIKQEDILRETIKKGFWRGEKKNFRKDGTPIYMDVRTRLVKDRQNQPIALCGIATDITSRKAYLRTILQSQYLQQLLLEFSENLLSAKSDDIDRFINNTLCKVGSFLRVDRAYVFLFDHDLGTASNTHEWCAENIDPQAENMQNIPISFAPNWLEVMGSGKNLIISDIAELPENWNDEKEMLIPQGIKSIVACPIMYQNVLLGFLGMDSVRRLRKWQDQEETNLRMMADLLAGALQRLEKEKELRAAKEKAEDANRLKSAFLATINHELRTPLNHILGFAQLLAYENSPSEINFFSSEIMKSGTNLKQMIQDIFDLALVEQSQIKPRLSRIDMITHFQDNKEQLTDILKASGKDDIIELIFKPDLRLLQTFIHTDVSKINQVLVNLFKNAVKYCTEGTIEFAIEKVSSSVLRYYVKDTGIGIPLEKQQQIFDFFYQAHDSETQNYGGVGIGLAISRRIVEIMGGRMYVDSVPLKGSTFSIEIPVKLESQAQESVPRDISDVPDLQGIKVLIVDDDPDSIFILKNYLQNTGADILEASCGKEAIEEVAANMDVRFVLMDIQMPGLDGYAGTKQILRLNPNIKVIGISSFSLSAKRATEAHGFCCTLTKPIRQHSLYEVISQCCKSHPDCCNDKL